MQIVLKWLKCYRVRHSGKRQWKPAPERKPLAWYTREPAKNRRLPRGETAAEVLKFTTSWRLQAAIPSSRRATSTAPLALSL